MFRNLTVATLSLVVSLCLAEIVLRFSLPPTTRFKVLQADLDFSFPTDPVYCPGIAGVSRFQTSSEGIRGKELSDSYTDYILTMGGSSTECLFLDQEETWPALLEKRLGPKTWVGNIGQSGRNSRHHVLQVRYLLDQLPQVKTILLLAGVNDFAMRLKHGQSFKPLEHNSKEFLQYGLGIAFDQYPEDLRFTTYDPNRPWYKTTAVWRLLRKLKDHLGARRLADREKIADQLAGCLSLKKVRETRQDSLPYINTLPDLKPGITEYRNNLLYIIRETKRRGIRLILLTHPAIWAEHMKEEYKKLLWFLPGDEPQSYYSAVAGARGLKQYNDVTRSLCKEMKLECLDAAALLPKDTTVFYDDMHFNEAGAQTLALLLYQYLLQNPRSP